MLTDEQVFKLMMERFDKVDEDNKQIQTDMKDHIKVDNEVHTIVVQHSAYWKLMLTISGALLAASVSVAIAFFH